MFRKKLFQISIKKYENFDLKYKDYLKIAKNIQNFGTKKQKKNYFIVKWFSIIAPFLYAIYFIFLFYFLTLGTNNNYRANIIIWIIFAVFTPIFSLYLAKFEIDYCINHYKLFKENETKINDSFNDFNLHFNILDILFSFNILNLEQVKSSIKHSLKYSSTNFINLTNSIVNFYEKNEFYKRYVFYLEIDPFSKDKTIKLKPLLPTNEVVKNFINSLFILNIHLIIPELNKEKSDIDFKKIINLNEIKDKESIIDFVKIENNDWRITVF